MQHVNLKNVLDELLSQPSETEWLEFKKTNISSEEIGEYLSALSNAALLHNKAAAYLVFGIEDLTHAIIGTSFRPRTSKVGNEDLENWLARLLSPRVDFKIEELEVDGKYVIMFIIDPAHSRPVAFKNTAFIRVGSYKKKLLDYPEKERKIWHKYQQMHFEDEIALSNCTDDDVLKLLDYPNYFRLLNINLSANKPAILEKLVAENFIKKRNDNKYDIHNLGAILLANQLNDFRELSRKSLRVIQYKENDRLNTIKEWVSEPGYAVGFKQIIDYIIDQLPQNELIERATRRQEKMYPDLAIRELLANALIHQDLHMRGTGPMVEIFQNRIEITNPGQPLINPLRFIDHNPKSRNEQLASFFRRVDFCEERGSGIDKVISSVESFQLPAPDFIAGDDYLRVIVYGYKSLRAMGKQDKIRAAYQHCCLKHVSGDLATNKSLRDRFEVSEKNYSIVSRIIADAMKEGLIKLYDPESKSKKHASYIPFWA